MGISNTVVTTSQWTVAGNDLSSELFQFRQICLEKKQRELPMADTELLALNSIYMFTMNPYEDCRSYVPHAFDPIMDEVSQELKQNYAFKVMEQDSTNLCITVEDLRLNNEDAEGVIISHLQSTRDQSKKTHSVAKVLYELHKAYSKETDFRSVDEDTFIDTAFKPFFDVIIPEVNHCRRVGQLATSMAGCRKRRHSSQGWILRADATIGIVIAGNRKDCLVVEVKAPLHPPSTDLTKMAFEMKAMFDHLINEHVENPITFGILVEGK
ncbi:hypothetical protein DFQ30_003224 [Apophysomyces sp. BC1015]|nr:hypothetical protein DFQ30_003224 [Apophysomyces sp. BC1015]